jgi:hypothetical protein
MGSSSTKRLRKGMVAFQFSQADDDETLPLPTKIKNTLMQVV